MQWLFDADFWLLTKINQDWSNPVFDFLMPIVTDLHKNKLFLFLVLPAVLFLLIRKKSNRDRLKIVSALVLGLLLTDIFCGQVLKNLVERKRPPIEHSEIIVRSPLYGNRSFPSNHAANMFCLAFLLTSFAPGWKWFAYGLAFLVAYSRSYVGLHYPTDWIAGALIGTLIAWLVLKLTQRVFA